MSSVAPSRSKFIRYSLLPIPGPDHDVDVLDTEDDSSREEGVESPPSSDHDSGTDEFSDTDIKMKRSRSWTKRSLICAGVFLGVVMCYFVFVFAPKQASDFQQTTPDGDTGQVDLAGMPPNPGQILADDKNLPPDDQLQSGMDYEDSSALSSEMEDNPASESPVLASEVPSEVKQIPAPDVPLIVGLDSSVLGREDMYKVHGASFFNFTQLSDLPYLANYRNPCWREPEDCPAESPDCTDDPVLRCLPYFLVLGGPKCGTGDVFLRLSGHQHIVYPGKTQIHFWDDQLYRGPLDYYITVFDQAAGVIDSSCQATDDGGCFHPSITGEATPHTLWANSRWRLLATNRGREEPAQLTPDLVRQLMPDVRLVVVLRNPVERLYSEYNFYNPASADPVQFDVMLDEQIQSFQRCLTTQSLRTCAYTPDSAEHAQMTFLRAGLYSVFLDDWLEVFPREQLYVLRLEDYRDDPEAELLKIFRFLRLPEPALDFYARMAELDHHPYVSRTKVNMNIHSLQTLQMFYGPFNHRLVDLLDDNKFSWGY